jgi:hypothetical protein
VTLLGGGVRGMRGMRAMRGMRDSVIKCHKGEGGGRGLVKVSHDKNCGGCLKMFLFVQRLFCAISIKKRPKNGDYCNQGSISSMLYKQLIHAQILKAQKDSQVVSLFCIFGIFSCKSCL